ncbi:MAG: hypothetical protein LQ344_002707 [Seirophora lacunosa]|nr:MAG: hypothetical protein LQ344_002707 [Seirophora lacunosa]
MYQSVIIASLLACFASSTIVPRGGGDGPPNIDMPTALTGQGLQDVPDEPRAPNTFSNGHAQDNDGFDWGVGKIPDLYQPRDIDIPFGRMYHGKMSFFDYGQYNNWNDNTATWSPDELDYANQTACGIPDNSAFQTKAAIHPYFLKYAGLDRYCMQDVCISFWPEGETPETSAFPDMIAKVTDICSTDPNDPTHCATPSDIKLDRAKVQVMYSIPSPGKDDADLQKSVYPRGTFWHLTKCWTNGLPQPAYQDNWWGQPPLPNNFMWSVDATRQQWRNNQKSYPSKGWDTYQNGMEIPSKEAIAAITPPSDWVPGQEPKWAPIAGGKGFGTPERSNARLRETAKAEGKAEGKVVDKVEDKVQDKVEGKEAAKEAAKEADKELVKAEAKGVAKGLAKARAKVEVKAKTRAEVKKSAMSVTSRFLLQQQVGKIAVSPDYADPQRGVPKLQMEAPKLYHEAEHLVEATTSYLASKPTPFLDPTRAN